MCVCACLCDTRNTKNTYTIHKHACVVQESHQDGPVIVVQYKFVKFSSDTYNRKRTRAHTTREHAIAYTHARMRRAH